MFKIFSFFSSIIFWIFMAVSMVIFFFIALFIWLLTLPFDRKRVVLHRWACFWGSCYSWFNPFLRINIEGIENIKRGKCYMLCPNHQSVLDIVVLYRVFRHYKWVAKSEIFKVPFLGWNMLLNDYISVNRKASAGPIAMMRHCEKHLTKGSSIMIFPEGTRSKDPSKLGRFRDGAFLLAKKFDVDVIPIAITGTASVVENMKSPFFPKIYKINIKILEAIEVGKDIPIKDLRVKCHNIIATELGMPTI